jgi:uncharacterized protein involved in outer membrane biogenesis
MKWLKRVGLIFGVLIAVLALVPFFVTLNDYIPMVEKEIAAIVGEPVSIDNLHASALPVPHARVEGITIGASDEIKIGTVTFTPNLWSLLRSEKIIRSVDVKGLVLSQKALGTLSALTQQKRSSGNIRVEKIRVHDATLKLKQSSFGPFDLLVQVSGPEQAGKLELSTQDGAMKARVTPERDGYVLAISARSWTLPVSPAIRFDELDIKGAARGSSAQFNDISGKLYGGTLTGKVTVGWDKGVALKGNLDLKQIELKQAAALVSPKTRVSGRLDAKPVFSSHAETVARLDEVLRIETPFTVHNGVLHGFDLIGAATSLVKQSSRGGDTRFDELAGHLAVAGQTYRFTDLRVASGALAARGYVTISPSKALSGQLTSHVKALGKSASIPLTVGGTLDSPMLYPNATALAGAAAGTAILGPGVGTAAGAKLGEFVDGIFGKKKP